MDDDTGPDAARGVPATGVPATGVPPLWARVGAFGSILGAGLAGGFIGWAITDLQCSGDCALNRGLGGLAGALIGAIGMAIVAVLALRAMHEWRTIVANDPSAAERELDARRRRRQITPGTARSTRVQ